MRNAFFFLKLKSLLGKYYMKLIGSLFWEISMRTYCLIERVNLSMNLLCKWDFSSMLPVPLLIMEVCWIMSTLEGSMMLVLMLLTLITQTMTGCSVFLSDDALCTTTIVIFLL